jgi:hypothetical protein
MRATKPVFTHKKATYRAGKWLFRYYKLIENPANLNRHSYILIAQVQFHGCRINLPPIQKFSRLT